MNTKLLTTALVFLLAAGCKQGLGERCQVNADCDSNICSKSSPQVCVSVDDKSQTPIDAEVPPPPEAGDAPADGP